MIDWLKRANDSIKRESGKIKNNHNKQAFLQRVSSLRARGSNPRTIAKHSFFLRYYMELLNKDYDKATREDVEMVMGSIEASNYAEATKVNFRAVLKSFYKYSMGEDMMYPKCVAWVKVEKKTKPEFKYEILTEEEISKIIHASDSIRNRAIISLLYDSGIRVGELINLKVKDVNLNADLAHITVDGKTGMRRIPIFFSASYIANYLNSTKKERDEPLFTGEANWAIRKEALDRAAIAKVLRIASKKAGITRRIYPHLFRHSRASYYANKLTEQQLKVYFGWTGDSRMAATYVHLSGRDVDNAMKQANGIKVENRTETTLKSKNCQRCQLQNELDSKYCNRCGLPLDEKLLVETQNKEDTMKQAIAEALKDPKAIEEIVHTYLLMKAKKGKV